MERATATWAHLTTPQGESLQGFWAMLDGQPLNREPLGTLKEAKAVAMLSNAAETVLQIAQTSEDGEAMEQAFNIIDEAYRQAIGWNRLASPCLSPLDQHQDGRPCRECDPPDVLDYQDGD